MSEHDNATYCANNDEKQNKTQEPNEDEDLPPPYPGAPGADISSDTAPLFPRPSGAQQHVTRRGDQPQVTQPRSHPQASQPGCHPQPPASAPPEDTAPYSGPQSPPPIPPNIYMNPYQQHDDYNQYIPLAGPQADYPRQQYATPPAPVPESHAATQYCPVYVPPPPPAQASRRDSEECSCEDCAACMLCSVACCECIVECFSCVAEISK